MKKHLLSLFMLLIVSFAHAKEYGNYDTKKLLTVTETASGKKYGIDIAYLDQMVADLSLHANNYPPQFDTPQDKQRASQDIRMLTGMLDIMVSDSATNPDLLLRTAILNKIGHNLNVPGAAEKANSLFQKHLLTAPADPRGNYMYGTFLAGVGKPKEAIPFLEKAISVGVSDAVFALGMSYLYLGDKAKALENLEAYKRRNPNDGNVDKVIDAIRTGNIELKKDPG